MFPTFVSSAPGKIILSGEHSVVHGTRAIATVVDKRTFITFSPNPLPLPVPTVQLNCDVSLAVDYDGYVLVHKWNHSDLIEFKTALFGKYMSDIEDYSSAGEHGQVHHDHNHGIGELSGENAVNNEKQKYFTSEEKLLDYVQDHTYPNRHLNHPHHGTLNQLTDIFEKMYANINVTVLRFPKTLKNDENQNINENCNTTTGGDVVGDISILIDDENSNPQVQNTQNTDENNEKQQISSLISSLTSSGNEFIVKPETLHSNIEVCPAKVFLFYYFLLIFTSTPVNQHHQSTGLLPTIHTSIISHIPMGAGLGSSASVCSALAGGYYQVLRYFPQIVDNKDNEKNEIFEETKIQFESQDRQVINTWAFQGERIIHGTPSGVDNTCTVYGGVLAFRRVNGQPEMEFLPSGCLPSTMKIFITNTRQPKNTKELVEGVHLLKKNFQFVVEPIFTSIEQITQVLLDSIRKYVNREQTFMSDDDLFTILKTILPINQSLLDALGVGHSKINEVLKISSNFQNELVTKLTGAGGGGCVITVAQPNINEDRIQEFVKLIEDNKMDIFVTVMGQDGVKVEILK